VARKRKSGFSTMVVMKCLSPYSRRCLSEGHPDMFLWRSSDEDDGGDFSRTAESAEVG